MEAEGCDGNQRLPVDWSMVVVADAGESRAHRTAVGRSLDEYAGNDAFDAYAAILLDTDLGTQLHPAHGYRGTRAEG